MLTKKKICQTKSGFTLIELLLVMAIFAILSGFASIGLINSQQKSGLFSANSQLAADMRAQQLKAQSGIGNNAPIAHGVYFRANGYTLFDGSSYNPSDTNNFVVTYAAGITTTNTFPNSQVVFAPLSGEVTGFINGQNTVTFLVPGSPTASPSPFNPNADTDGDGFSNTVENFVGTDPFKPCGVGAWPPDFDNDGVVTVLDLSLFAKHNNTSQGQPNYSARYDLNADGVINGSDLAILNSLYGKSCSAFPPYIGNPGGNSTLTLNNFGAITIQ